MEWWTWNLSCVHQQSSYLLHNISACCALDSWRWDRHWQVYTSVCSEKVKNGSSPFTSKSQTLATGSASFNVNSQPQTLVITVNTAITSSHFLLCKWPLTTSSCNNTINDQTDRQSTVTNITEENGLFVLIPIWWLGNRPTLAGCARTCHFPIHFR